MGHVLSLIMASKTHLETLYDDHAQTLYSFLLGFTRSENDTKDVLQELFHKLAESPEILKGVQQPKSFLIKLSRNLAIDLMRRRATRDRNYHQYQSELGNIFEGSSETDEEAFRSKLSKALLELPEEQRSVVQLKLWEDLTFEEIATSLEISANTAASRYRYGLDKLRELLRPIYEEIRYEPSRKL